MLAPLNVLGTPIKPCSTSPLTGWFRDGCCNTDENDRGATPCAVGSQRPSSSTWLSEAMTS